MTMIRPETEMKDSGIQWLGNIPKEWSIIKGKYILKQLSRSVLESDNVVTCFRDGEVTLRSNRRELGFTNSLKEIGYQGVEPGDLVVHGMDGFAGAIGISDSRGKMSPIINVLESGECKKYLMYYLRGLAFVNVFLGLSTGIRERSCDLRWNKLANLEYTIPPLSEQQAIADYLDETCSKIDEIIAEAKASIDEYKKLRQGIIFEAVTKGLDKNVEMKSTSVGWIGTVPSHWRVAKIRQVAEFYNGDRSSKYPSGNDIVSEGIIFITSNNLGYIVLNTNISTNKFITKQKYDDLGGAKLRINDIVFCLRGSVGKCAINKTFDEGTIASSLVVIRAKKVDADYLNYVLQNHRITDEAIVNAIGIGSLNLAAHDISEFYMPIPPEREMQDIVRYLDDKVGNVDDLISEKESLINDLEAYKKSLIYEVVTGKRRVV